SAEVRAVSAVISCTVRSLWSSLYCLQSLVIPVLPQSLVISCTVRSLWSSPVLSAVSGHLLYCPQSAVSGHPCTVSAVSGHPCTVSAVSGHLLYCVRSLWSSPVLCPQSLVISCTVRSLWSSPVLCPQSLVISCTVSAVSGHPCTVRSLWSSLYCVRS
ncbi:unnamed protein product, partial [Staurois parvus]